MNQCVLWYHFKSGNTKSILSVQYKVLFSKSYQNQSFVDHTWKYLFTFLIIIKIHIYSNAYIPTNIYFIQEWFLPYISEFMLSSKSAYNLNFKTVINALLHSVTNVTILYNLPAKLNFITWVKYALYISRIYYFDLILLICY